MKKSKMNLKKWYKGITVPSVGSKLYPQFIASCVGIVNKIVERELEKSITVRFGDTPTAYADQSKNLIVISRDFATGDFTKASGSSFSKSDDVIPQILGVIVHEAAHFAYSPKTLEPFVVAVESILGSKVNPSLCMLLGNTVEDIYIEAEVINQIPVLDWMLERLNLNILGEDAYTESVSRIASLDSAPTSQVELQNAVSHLIFAKHMDLVPTTEYMNNLWNLAQSARTAKSIEERFQIVAQLYELLIVPSDEDEGEDEQSDEGDEQSGDEQQGEESEEADGSGSEGSSSESSEDSQEEQGELSEEDITEATKSVPNGPTASHEGSETKPIKEWDSFAEKLNDYLKREVESLEADELWTEDGSKFSKNSITPRMSSEEVEIDTRYAGLARVGRQAATTNRPYGLDQRRGHSIRKLHRIATDGRIFAESVPSKAYKPMEVVILMDCSGSMWSGYRMQNAAKAVIGATAGLKEARCDVKVLGHTADIKGITLTMYDIKDWNDPVSVASKRMNTLCSYSEEYPFGQNRDHLAIQEAASKFRSNSQQRRRLLIVVSDGEPCANGNYFGYHAKVACQKAVEETRRKGIDVISISITQEAMDANDFIYTKEQNVCNEDANVIDEVCRKLIRA